VVLSELEEFFSHLSAVVALVWDSPANIINSETIGRVASIETTSVGERHSLLLKTNVPCWLIT
jgi:hypothetical protein